MMWIRRRRNRSGVGKRSIAADILNLPQVILKEIIPEIELLFEVVAEYFEHLNLCLKIY